MVNKNPKCPHEEGCDMLCYDCDYYYDDIDDRADPIVEVD